MALIDLAVILPFYLPLLFPFDARILRLIRLVRLMRLLKVIRYSESLRVFYRRLPDEEERTWNGLPRDSLFAGDGFGSYLPDYTARQIFGAIIALLGIGLFALPAGILGSGFVGTLRSKSSGRFYVRTAVKRSPENSWGIQQIVAASRRVLIGIRRGCSRRHRRHKLRGRLIVLVGLSRGHQSPLRRPLTQPRGPGHCRARQWG